MGLGSIPAVRAPGRRAEHRIRGRRPAPGGRPRQAGSAPLHRSRRHCHPPHLRRARQPHGPLRQRTHGPGRGTAGKGLHAPGPLHRAVHDGPGHAVQGTRAVPALLRLRARARTATAGAGRRPGSCHHRGPVPAQGRGEQATPAASGPRPARWLGPRSAAGHRVLRRAHEAGTRGVRHPAHGSEGHGAAPLHQRHDRYPQGCGPCARSGRSPPRDGGLRTRPPPGGRLLVHGGPRVGDRYLVRDHRSAHPRCDRRGGRGGLRCPPLVPHPRQPAGHCLVHRADGDPHADARHPQGRLPRAPRAVRPFGSAIHRERGRAAQPGSRPVGAGGARPADPRQLVADGDRSNHDCQLRGQRHPARLHGTALARCGGRSARTR